MSNRKTIKVPLVKGTFTTILHRMITDTRLTDLGYRILTHILAQADSYNLRQGDYVKRYGKHKDTIRKAFNNLIECGYIRRHELKRGHYYYISEFGNLNTEVPVIVEEKNESSIEINNEQNLVVHDETAKENSQLDTSDNKMKLSNFITSLGDFIDDDSFFNRLNEKISEFTNENSQTTDIASLKAAMKPILEREQNRVYRNLHSITDKRANNYSNKAKAKFEEYLKDLIYNKMEIPERKDESSRWLKFQCDYPAKPKLDHETMVQDAISEAIADGDY